MCGILVTTWCIAQQLVATSCLSAQALSREYRSLVPWLRKRRTVVLLYVYRCKDVDMVTYQTDEMSSPAYERISSSD